MRFKPIFPIMSSNSLSFLLHRSKFSSLQPNSSLTTPNIQRSLVAESELYSHLCQACIRQCWMIKAHHPFDEKPQRVARAFRTAKAIHASGLKFGFASKGLLGNAIFDVYAKCGSRESAENVFVRLEKRDVFAWNSLISMYSRRGFLSHVLQSFGSLLACAVSPNEFTFAMVSSACAGLGDIDNGRVVHCGVIKMGLELFSFCQGALIDMYAKCNFLSHARRIFERAVSLDTVSLTAMIAAYVQASQPEEAITVFEQMQNRGIIPDQVAIVTVINAYVSLGRLATARALFSELPNPNVVAWNVMISGHAKREQEEEAISFFLRMRKAGVRSSRSTLGSVLSAIASLAFFPHGLLVHAEAIKEGLDSNFYVGSSLLNMYAKCSKMNEAKLVFDCLSDKNLVSWNAMLGGYIQNGRALDVVQVFFHMIKFGPPADEYTYTSIFSACASLEYSEMGRQLHAVVTKNEMASNLFVGNALIDMYSKSGALEQARRQFELMRNHDSVSWNSIIVGYVQEEEEEEGFFMFKRMISNGVFPDEVSLASILSACANVKALDQGHQIHCMSLKAGLETSVYVGSSLIDMYSKCGGIEAARKVFSSMPIPSVVSMNALMAGYNAQGIWEETLELFRAMQETEMKPSEITFSILSDACSGVGLLPLGEQIHSLVLKWGLLYVSDILDISLLSMYINNRRKKEADVIFSEFSHPKSRVLWTAMVSGFAQNNYCKEAYRYYQGMRGENLVPDQAMFASVLRACAVLASLMNGREVHSLIFRTGFESDELTCSALVDMYSKCGDVRGSMQVFEEMGSKNDVVSWNSMIVGLAKNGYAENALEMFEEMNNRSNVLPDEVTFLGVLNACSHAGKVEEGRKIFESMVNNFGIVPRSDHNACMVDLLGRWGFLEEAWDFIDGLESGADGMVWGALLGACRIHGDEERGRRAAEKLRELHPEDSSSYVLLSNIYAESGNWKGAGGLRKEMEEKGVKKVAGYSWM